MQNFLDLLDINPRVEICIDISAVVDNGDPRCRIVINDCVLYDDCLHHKLSLVHRVGLLQPICIGVELRDKIYSAYKDTALRLDKICIDGLDIIPGWTHLAQYHNDHHADEPTNYLGYNGVWRLELNEPFYRWRHAITGQGWLLEPTTAIRD